MYNDNIDFNALWKQQVVCEPNIDALRTKLNAYKRTNVKQLLLFNTLLLATTIAVVFIWYQYKPQYVSTKIGIVLVIWAMAVFALGYNNCFLRFNKIDDTQSSSDYLKSLMQLKTKQTYLQTTMLRVYFIMLSLGICLYMYEYVLMMPIVYACLAYGVTLLWIAFNWFYLRPKIIKKQETKLNHLISKCNEVNKQLDT